MKFIQLNQQELSNVCGGKKEKKTSPLAPLIRDNANEIALGIEDILKHPEIKSAIKTNWWTILSMVS